MQDPIKILGVPIHAMTMQEAVKMLEERMLAKEQTFVVTANAEIIMMCQENAEYKKIICEDAELVLPDGAGAVWAGRHLGYKVPERVAGFDLYNELLDLSAHKGYKAYFFGGSPGVAEAAKAKAEELYPGVQVVGCHNGYFKDEDVPQIIADINASGAAADLPEEQRVIDRAKALLMNRNNMSEQEAHRFLQKRCMDTGTKLYDMALAVLKSQEL